MKSDNWKEYYDKENVLMYIYEKALLNQKVFNDECYIKMSDLNDILKEYAE